MNEIDLPMKSGEVVDASMLEFIVQKADFLVHIGTPRTGRKCFFRAYMIVYSLARLGVTAELHVGLKNLAAQPRALGHCWVCVDGDVIAEGSNPQEEYPVALGEGGNGVCYWVSTKGLTATTV